MNLRPTEALSPEELATGVLAFPDPQPNPAHQPLPGDNQDHQGGARPVGQGDYEAALAHARALENRLRQEADRVDDRDRAIG